MRITWVDCQLTPEGWRFFIWRKRDIDVHRETGVCWFALKTARKVTHANFFSHLFSIFLYHTLGKCKGMVRNLKIEIWRKIHQVMIMNVNSSKAFCHKNKIFCCSFWKIKIAWIKRVINRAIRRWWHKIHNIQYTICNIQYHLYFSLLRKQIYRRKTNRKLAIHESYPYVHDFVEIFFIYTSDKGQKWEFSLIGV